MRLTESRAVIERQLTVAWMLYRSAALRDEQDTAALAARQVDRLLERLPRQRQP